jgi:hypothetical protein
MGTDDKREGQSLQLLSNLMLKLREVGDGRHEKDVQLDYSQALSCLVCACVPIFEVVKGTLACAIHLPDTHLHESLLVRRSECYVIS